MKNEDIKFDGAIRQKLESITPVIKPGSWENLSKRMDVVEQSEAFDKKASDRLESIHIPYQASSWEVLAERLALERGRIQAVLHYKAMEVSLLLLLLVTAWQYLPILTIEETQQPTQNFPIASLENLESNIDRSNIVALDEGEVQATSLKELNEFDQLISVNNDPNTFSSINWELEAERLLSNSEVQTRIITGAVTPLTTLPIADRLELSTEQNPHADFKEIQARKVNDLSSPTDNFRQDGAITALDDKALSLLDYGNPDDLLEYIRPVERKTFLRIGFMGSPDYNRVITPNQRIENGTEVAFDRYSVSYSGGVSIGVEHGKWEIETGAIYALRKYQAIPTLYVSGNIREGYSAQGLRDFELNTIDIPLKFRYNFLVHDKWRLYGLAGVSLNVVLNANYYSVDESAFNSLAPTRPQNGTSSAERPQALKNKKLTKGWIEGGSFTDNATPYANFGVGIERYMSHRWSVFTQPSYQHALPFFNNGLGPYNDKIHNFGVNMGLKVRL